MEHVTTRKAPPGTRLDVPRFVQVIGGLVGLGTVGLGVIYVLAPPARPSGVAMYSVVAVLEPGLGAACILVGTAVVTCTLVCRGRAIAHGVASVVHGGYVVALVISIVLTEPFRPTVTAVLAVIAALAHWLLSLEYFQRGYR